MHGGTGSQLADPQRVWGCGRNLGLPSLPQAWGNPPVYSRPRDMRTRGQAALHSPENNGRLSVRCAMQVQNKRPRGPSRKSSSVMKGSMARMALSRTPSVLRLYEEEAVAQGGTGGSYAEKADVPGACRHQEPIGNRHAEP